MLSFNYFTDYFNQLRLSVSDQVFTYCANAMIGVSLLGFRTAFLHALEAFYFVVIYA